MQTNTLPFSLSPIDSRLVVSKPQHGIKEDTLHSLIAANRLVKTRKRDGHRHLLAVAGSVKKSKIHISTRTMAEVTSRYPHLVERVRALVVPPGTLLDGELYFDNEGIDSLSHLGKIAKSTPEHAIVLQGTMGRARYRIFNLIAYRGKLLTDVSFSSRMELLLELFDKHHVDQELCPIEFVNESFDEAVLRIQREKWEGMVLYDSEATTAIRLDGDHESPPRPVGAWKWKPLNEDDFFVRTWEWGTPGKAHEWRMGKLNLLQLDPDTREEISCGEVGIGFSVKDRDFFAKATYPLVVQVKFLKRNPSGACREPRFMHIREEKTPNECILPEELRSTVRRAR